jgi:hypothetical protein
MIFVLAASPARAAQQNVPALPVELRASAPSLDLLGQGRLTWWGFHVYDARLYAEDAAFGFDRHFVLEIEYARDFGADDIVDVSVDEMRRLTGADEARLMRWREAMTRIFPDVRDGDRLIGHHDPAGGARFYNAVGPIGAVADPDFARAFFAIWLDPETKTRELRRALLGAEDGEDDTASATGFSPTN